MNKKLIGKFKREFDCFLVGKSLKIRTSRDADWKELEEHHWNFGTTEGIDIVLDDEYVDLRIARIDGKTLECWNKFRDEWAYLCPALPIDSFKASECRVKPPSLFRNDDTWLRHNESREIVLSGDIDDEVESEEDYSLWEPVYYRYCVFYSKGESYLVEPFGEKNESQGTYRSALDQTDWENVAPLEFISRLNRQGKD